MAAWAQHSQLLARFQSVGSVCYMMVALHNFAPGVCGAVLATRWRHGQFLYIGLSHGPRTQQPSKHSRFLCGGEGSMAVMTPSPAGFKALIFVSLCVVLCSFFNANMSLGLDSDRGFWQDELQGQNLNAMVGLPALAAKWVICKDLWGAEVLQNLTGCC